MSARAKRRIKGEEPEEIKPQEASEKRAAETIELDAIREMERTGDWRYELPNGSCVEVASRDEYENVKRVARPYVEAGDELSGDAWNDVLLFLKNNVALYDLHRQHRENRIRVEKIKQVSKRQEMSDSLAPIQSEIVKQINALQATINTQRLKLDALRSMSNSESASLEEFLAGIKEEAVEFCEDHLGEFQWMTTCPSPDCRFYREPFTVLQQAPHFAFDCSVSPQVVFNRQVYELTALYYEEKEKARQKLEASFINLGTGYPQKYDSAGLSFTDAARILRISPIGWIAAIHEKQEAGLYFPLDLGKILNSTKLLAQYIESPEKSE